MNRETLVAEVPKTTIAAQPVPLVDTSTQLVVPQPLKVQIDSPTDLLSAVVTPLAIALLGVYITWLTNRGARRSSVAVLRHTWSGDFQKACADFVSSATHLHFKKIADRNYLLKPEADEQLVRLTTARASIRMLLPLAANYTGELTQIMDDVEDALFHKNPTSSESARSHLTAFVDKAQSVQKIVWKQIGDDLSLPK